MDIAVCHLLCTKKEESLRCRSCRVMSTPQHQIALLQSAMKSNLMGVDFDHGKPIASEELCGDWNSYDVYVSETSVAVRLAFIGKVYGVFAFKWE